MNDQVTNIFKSFQPTNEKSTNALKILFPAINQLPAASQNPFSGNEQFANVVKASIEVQIDFFNILTASNLATVEKLSELNMSTAKVTLEETAVITGQLISSQDAQEIQVLLGALPKSVSAKATAYGSHLANINSASQTEIARAAEQQFAKVGLKLSDFIDQALKNMPAGAESSAATAKAVIASVSAGYEKCSKSAQHAAEAVATQASTAADKVSQLAAEVPDIGTNVQ